MSTGRIEKVGQWWRNGVLYQVYPRSFADGNGDGIGDLEGVISRLDYLEWLGIDGIWLSPVTVSPQADFGYDVADYCNIDPDYGDMATLLRLIAEGEARGISILMDLVPNHTSRAHPWFLDAMTSPEGIHRDFFVWANGKGEGKPGQKGSEPNNWISSFGGPAWTYDETSQQWFLHNFLPEQPDLNWWNPAVPAAFEEILHFWWNRGIAGFRIDVCHMMIKDAELRDNPPATKSDSFVEQMFGQRSEWNSGRPETHGILRRWRELADAETPPRLLLGETSVDNVESLASYYGANNDELHLGFNFVFLEAPFEAEALRETVEKVEALLPRGSWPVWTGSNHDVSRLATRWAQGNRDLARLALLMLFCLRGTPVLYQGDEIGLIDGEITEDDLLDPVGKRFWPHYAGRDPERTPMPWEEGPGWGFGAGDTPTWLPMVYPPGSSVAAQKDLAGSTLEFVRHLLAIRRSSNDLVEGDYESEPSPQGTWAWRRGQTTTVLLNFSDRPVAFTDVTGSVLIATDAALDGAVVGGESPLILGANHGAVIT